MNQWSLHLCVCQKTNVALTIKLFSPKLCSRGIDVCSMYTIRFGHCELHPLPVDLGVRNEFLTIGSQVSMTDLVGERLGMPYEDATWDHIRKGFSPKFCLENAQNLV